MESLPRIRRQLAEFIELQMAEQGAKLQDVDLWGEFSRCPLVNPACPVDLCILPAGHIGTEEEEVHILGTDNFMWATRYHRFPMAALGTSDEELIRLGWEEQKRIWPDAQRHYPGA